MTIETFLSQLCEHCGLTDDQVQVDLEDAEEVVRVTLRVSPEESGLLIGYHGDTLDSIQRLTRIVFQEKYDGKKIILNVNEYREQREEKLKEMVQTAAQHVLDAGGTYTFHHYLPAHERFVIHSTLGDDPAYEKLESISRGSGKDRKLTIRLKQESQDN
jgi:spoIIIJ-associated protein